MMQSNSFPPTLTEAEIHTDYQAKRDFFDAGNTIAYDFRMKQLKRLKDAVKRTEPALFEAFQKDFRKPPLEVFATEIGLLYTEINYAMRHLDTWMQPERVSAGVFALGGVGKIIPSPHGIVLIIAPWNYPMMLLLTPLVGAIAAGCCAVLKPSEEAPNVALCCEKIVKEAFEPSYISTVQGVGADIVPKMIETVRFDYIFFTGSNRVGQMIARQAVEQFIPYSLELGGKSPCIIDEHFDLNLAARRIAQSKFLNAGQTCVATDYVLVPENRKEQLIQHLKEHTLAFYGTNAKLSPDFPRIINLKHFNRVIRFLADGKIVFGGETDADTLYIAPTILTDLTLDALIMKEEIFGPILPILTYNTLEDVFNIVKKNPFPLALYLFTKNKKLQNTILQKINFGGGTINQTLSHFGAPTLPVGGTQYSGLGRYHGKASFDTFSHFKSVTFAPTWDDFNLRYPPYSALGMKIMRWLVR